MNNQQAVVDQVVQNLAFDVEAISNNESKQTKNGTPLNVKIKVRKKDEINIQHDVSSIADNTSRTIQKVRLVNSDQTIMTFDVFMEAEFEKKPPRKLRKHIFDMLKPGICLGAVDDDEQPYMPSSTTYSANITEPTVATKSNGTLKQTFVLAKNVYQTYSTSTQPGVQRWLFGNCKPGGCLDPPFSEDKYSYKPSTRLGPEREDIEIEETKSDILNSSKKPITPQNEETQSNGRHSSIFDNGLFKKKPKSSDKSTNTKLPAKTDSIIDVYPGESATNSISTHSNPIITYPPKPKTNPRTSTDKTVRSIGPSEDKPRNSLNDHSEPYFIPPKGVQRIKDKLALDPNDQQKHQSSDAADSKIPIPIPVSFSNDSSKRKPEVIPTNNDIIKKNIIPDQHIPDQKLSDQELQGAINLKDIELPSQHVSSKILVPVPILFPINYSDPNNTDTNEDSMMKDNIYDDMKLIHPKKSSEIKEMPSTNKDTPFEGSKDMEQNIEPGLGGNESLSNATPNLKDSNTEIDAISENVLRTTHNFSDQEDAIPGKFLRTGGNISDQETDTDISVNLDMKRDSKRKLSTDEIRETVKQNDNANKVKINTEDMKPGSKEAETTDEIIKPAEQNYRKEDTEKYSEEEKVIDGIGKLEKQTEINDKTLTPTYYSKDDIKPDCEGEKVIERTKEPSNQKEIKNEAVIPSKYIEDDIEPYSEGDKISLNRIVKPEKQSELIEDKKIKRDSKEDTITDEIEKPVIEKENQHSLVSPTIYVEDSSDIFEMPDTHQNIGTPKIEEKKDSHNNLSKLPNLQNNMSLQNSSKTSVNKTKRSDTPDFFLDNIEYGDTDLGIHMGEKRLSNSHHETDIWDGKENVGETAKPNNDDNMDPYIEIEKLHTNGKLTNIIAAPVTIDNIEETLILGSIKEFYDEKKIVSESMAPSFKKFDGDEDAHSTVSHETIGSKSFIDNTDGFVPSTSAEKLPGGTALSFDQSVKSAMKKDTTFIDFRFHSYLNDKNERIIQTVDSENAPKRLSSDSVTVIKSQIRISSNDIRIPVDSEHDIFIQIKKANANQRVSIGESRLENVIDTETGQCNNVENESSEVKVEGSKDKIQENYATADHFLDYYEQELVPLQSTIKNLREEIDFLAAQQSTFKDKLYCTSKSKLPRLTHSNKKCYGCGRK